MVHTHTEIVRPYLSTEGAGVLGVLGDFDLLHHLTQGGTIAGTIFTNDSNLLRALGLRRDEDNMVRNRVQSQHNLTMYSRLLSSEFQANHGAFRIETRLTGQAGTRRTLLRNSPSLWIRILRSSENVDLPAMKKGEFRALAHIISTQIDW